MAPHRAHPDVLSMSGIDVPVMSSADVEISISIQTPSIDPIKICDLPVAFFGIRYDRVRCNLYVSGFGQADS